MADSTDHTDRDARLRKTLEGLRNDPDALIEIILRQAEQNRQLRARVEELEQKVKELIAEPERLREEGHEAFYRREPTRIDRRGEVPMGGCPECGNPVTEVRPIRQVVQELPPIDPETVEVVTYRGECPEHGTVETSHPLKATKATGAAQVHFGPRAQAIALLLRERHARRLRSQDGRAVFVSADGEGPFDRGNGPEESEAGSAGGALQSACRSLETGIRLRHSHEQFPFGDRHLLSRRR